MLLLALAATAAIGSSILAFGSSFLKHLSQSAVHRCTRGVSRLFAVVNQERGIGYTQGESTWDAL